MKLEEYPGLYQSASASSAEAQSQYLWLIGLQYALLLLAAITALGFEASTWFSAAYSFLLICSTALLLLTAFVKPEKDWYASRALSESLKTSTWRFMMNAQPFDRALSQPDVTTKFIKILKDISDANTYIRHVVKRKPTTAPAISSAMYLTRQMSLTDRIARYTVDRIADQRNWYIKKARANRRNFTIFVALGVIIQGVAIALAVLRFKSETLIPIWPTEPMLVMASAVIGWTQIKKFNELASAYTLTAHEIGLIEARVQSVATEDDFSDFVNEAELAFSREHTQWVARQDSYNP